MRAAPAHGLAPWRQYHQVLARRDERSDYREIRRDVRLHVPWNFVRH